ncbi:hypothetical protein CTI12_AA453410 [Artemisia annua]|uniref:Uncharacterized protein n=1 Tax=Artemisia annua TaxID=35608 RepID=A0A2U1LU50_ARTAN|nr:hypothetical protein CTI12_AA453410 [Artemisia annua]
MNLDEELDKELDKELGSDFDDEIWFNKFECQFALDEGESNVVDSNTLDDFPSDIDVDVSNMVSKDLEDLPSTSHACVEAKAVRSVLQKVVLTSPKFRDGGIMGCKLRRIMDHKDNIRNILIVITENHL